jgi:hypothetical protein
LAVVVVVVVVVVVGAAVVVGAGDAAACEDPPEPTAMGGLTELTTPTLTEMPYTPELRALYYNTAGVQVLSTVADRCERFTRELNPQNRMAI